MKLRLAACIYATLMLALAGFASTALAGSGGHGNGGGKQQHQQSNGQSKHAEHNQQSSGGSGDNSTGVKPSNSTQHDTHANASSDRTKQYGNGQTAGRIATKAGYGNATLHGPGNSQPHKVNCGGHEVDVHALKHKSCGAVEGAEHSEHHSTKAKTESQHKPSMPTQSDHKVTICHKTGSATNPYVEITVDYHALKNGHTAAKGDIIPAPASGCPTGQVSSTTTQQTTTEQESCTQTKVVEKTVVSVEHFIGPKGSGRFRVIHPNSHSSHFRDKHPDVILTTSVPTTVTVKAPCPTSTATESVTTTEQSTTTVAAAAVPAPPAPAAPAAAAPAPAAPVAAGGVLGATAPLHTTAKPKPAGGVLGATVRLGKSVGSSTLPFTGLPLWIFALVAGGLILAGAAARRAGAES
jgi:hypothetical protein